jgi:TonB family protein
MLRIATSKDLRLTEGPDALKITIATVLKVKSTLVDSAAATSATRPSSRRMCSVKLLRIGAAACSSRFRSAVAISTRQLRAVPSGHSVRSSAGLACSISLSALFFCASPLTAQEPIHLHFVAEEGTKIRYSSKEGLFQLREGPGWIRTPEVLEDFVLAFDIRPNTRALDAEVVVRAAYTDTKHLEGYRIVLPDPAHPERTTWLGGSPAGVTVVEEYRIAPGPSGAWRHVAITARGTSLGVAIDGATAGSYVVEELGGLLLVTNARGFADMRDVRITTVPPLPSESVGVRSSSTLQKMGGRPPRLIHEVKPNYTRGAMERRVQGMVEMEAVVRADGSVDRIRIMRSLDPDLNQMAIQALQQWKFAPGYFNGVPIPTLVRVELTFTLRK